MSQNFRVDGRVVWNPSNRVAKLFVGVAQAVAEIAGKPVGFRDTGADEYEVDLAVFETFVEEAVRTYLGSSHPIMRTLLEGFLATALVLVDRAGGTVAALSETPLLDVRDVSVGPQGSGHSGTRRDCGSSRRRTRGRCRAEQGHMNPVRTR